MEWWTIEVCDAPGAAASAWQSSYDEKLVEAALTHRAQQWAWVTRPWGVVLELAFLDEADWLRFRGTPVVRAALDAVPEHALLIYPGRGGGSGARVPRRPRPAPLSGAAALPDPSPQLDSDPEHWLGPQQGRLAATA